MLPELNNLGDTSDGVARGNTVEDVISASKPCKEPEKKSLRQRKQEIPRI